MNAMPIPITRNGRTSRKIGVSDVISIESQVSPIASAENPKPMIDRGWARSTMRPTTGANTPPAMAIGAVSSADSVGVSPHTAWA